VFIIEDDVDFADGFFAKLKLIQDFDMLFLNGTDGRRKNEPFNNEWVKANEVYGAFGYIVSQRFYDKCIELLERNDRPVDSVYAMFMSAYKVYKLREPLVFHRKGVSDIMGIVPKNYKHLEKVR